MRGLRCRVRIYDGLDLIEVLIVSAAEAADIAHSWRAAGYRVLTGLA